MSSTKWASWPNRWAARTEAIAFFKEIYSVDIKYRDIAQRIEASYQKK